MSEPPFRSSSQTTERSPGPPALSAANWSVATAPVSSTRASLLFWQGEGQSPQRAPWSPEPDANTSAFPFRRSSHTANGAPASRDTEERPGEDGTLSGVPSTGAGEDQIAPPFAVVAALMLCTGAS